MSRRKRATRADYEAMRLACELLVDSDDVIGIARAFLAAIGVLAPELVSAGREGFLDVLRDYTIQIIAVSFCAISNLEPESLRAVLSTGEIKAATDALMASVVASRDAIASSRANRN